MSLLTEQEIRDIARSVKEIGENSDRALILAAQKAVIEKIKAQGRVAWRFKSPLGFVKLQKDMPCMNRPEAHNWTPLYRLPDGD